MATRWESLTGDTSVFAIRMAFASDPDEGRSIDPEVGLSWGSFQIWVEGRNLCSHLEEGERIDSAHWYLLPLLEWFVRCWNPLLHEERLPVKVGDETGWTSLHATRFPPPTIEEDEQKASGWESAWQDWWMRHGLQAAREGGIVPGRRDPAFSGSGRSILGSGSERRPAVPLRFHRVAGLRQAASRRGRRALAYGSIERERVPVGACGNVSRTR